jgi:hypothetical protein
MNSSEPLVIDFKNFEKHFHENFKNNFNETSGETQILKNEPIGWCMPNKIWVAHDFYFIDFLESLPKSSILIIALNFGFENKIDFKQIKKYLKSKKLVLIINGLPEKQAEYLADILDINLYEGWQPLIDSEILKNNERYYRVFYRALAAKINIKSLYRATQIKTTHMFLRNSLINAPLAYRHIPVDGFRGIQKNKPVLIVAAGPSLNKQLPILFKYKDFEYKILLDIVLIDHWNKTITPIDLKSSEDGAYSFMSKIYKYRYDIQASLYHKGIIEFAKSNFKDYNVENFLFLVGSFKYPETPLLYNAQNLMNVGEYGND